MSYKQDCIIINGEVTVNIYNNSDENEVETETTGTKSIHRLRTTSKVSSAKKQVKSRDGRCVCCGEMEKQIQVHHILPIAKYPELAADMGNMICLCQSCHSRYHQMYEDENVNAVTFAKYLKDYGTRIYGG